MSVSVKDSIIRKMVVETAISEEVISAIIDHQFTSMVEATGANNSIDMSGFGRFYFYREKAGRYLDKITTVIETFEAFTGDVTLSPKKRKIKEDMIEVDRKIIQDLKQRLYGLDADI